MAAVAAAPEDGKPNFYGHKCPKPIPWFDGPQAPWAGETPPIGIYVSLPLASPAVAGEENILLLLKDQPEGFAGLLHPQARISLVRADFSLSAIYIVTSMADAEDGSKCTRAGLYPAVRAEDAGAGKLHTRGQPVPPLALGIQAGPRRQPYAHPETARGPVWNLPGPHAPLGWGNASAALSGTE